MALTADAMIETAAVIDTMTAVGTGTMIVHEAATMMTDEAVVIETVDMIGIIQGVMIPRETEVTIVETETSLLLEMSQEVEEKRNGRLQDDKIL